MPTRVYLLRHGIAFPHGTPGVNEDDRPLTSRGEGRVEQVARGLKRLGTELDVILTSPLPRARQTAEIAARVLDLQHRLENADELRPSATPSSLRDWLESRTEERVMLVGHNPSMTGLLALLIGLPDGSPPFELKKAGVAELFSDSPGHYHLQWLATPRLFRRLPG